MVIVFNHIIASTFLFYRHPERFLVRPPEESEEASKSEHVEQESKIKYIATATDFRSLHVKVRDAVHQLASKSVTCVVYLLDHDTGEFYADRDNLVRIPHSGIAWECLELRKSRLCQNIDPEDPLCAVLCAHQNNAFWRPKSVLCHPVEDDLSKKIISVVVVSSNVEEEIDGLSLKPVGNQIVACYRNLCKGNGSSPATPDRRVSSPSDKSDKESLIRLCGELYDQDATALQVKIIKYLEEQTNAECGFLLLVVPETQELFCQVIGHNVLDQEVRFPGQSSSFSKALETKEPMSLEDIPLENKKGLEEFTGRSIQSLLCVPVISKQNACCIALACVVNKGDNESFHENDVQTIRTCFQFTSTVLTSTLAFQHERKLKIQTQAMLQVARNLFTHLDDLTKLLREIMQEARNLTQAERCSVFLIDEETDELVAKVFDGITTNDNEVQSEIRMPITQGIAGHVATTGNLLNIKDAYSHPMFYRGIDDSTGFRTRNILCFPIKNEAGVVLGVAQLCNKKTGPYFTTFDEDVASAFAVYCCISISHSLMYQRVIAAQIRNSLANELMMYHMKCLMYKKLQDSQHRNRLANELMIYHMQVAQEDVDTLAHCTIPPTTHWNQHFDRFHFPPRQIIEDETPSTCLTMFEDLGFIQRFRIKRDTLARFVLMVRRGYRNPPYHNWMHAFSVAHFCYSCIKNLDLNQHLEDTELFALFVSCLCHDIDHRGTNNSYQVASKSVLAALYSSEGSVLERHHFAQTMCIVNTEGCNIFENLTSKDYQQVLDLVRDIILATDLAHHLRILKNIETMAKDGYRKTSLKNHKLLLCLLMTASDLSDQTKPWNYAKHIAALIYNEFFSQGDLEKSLGKEPMEMMDRKKARIPELQIGFLDHIALPVYKVLTKLFNAAQPVSTAVEDNRKHWEKICALIKLRRGGSCEQMSYDQILALEEEEDTAEMSNHIQQNGQS